MRNFPFFNFCRDAYIIRQSKQFEVRYYLICYPDVEDYRWGAFWHFMRHGAYEGRNPNASFDTLFYLKTYPDVAISGMNPLAHYIRYGKNEGRASKASSQSVKEFPPIHSERNDTWYKDAVGGMWDDIGMLQHQFLLQQGLQPHHYLLDVGCGSLRGGRHLINYLEGQHYFGIDRDENLLQAGIECVLSMEESQKSPTLKRMEDFNFTSLNQTFDFAIAQSVFTHLPWNSILRCLANMQKVLTPTGKFFATFLENSAPEGTSFLDPISHKGGVTTYMDRDPFHYEFNTFCDLAEKCNLKVEYIGEWQHPRNQKMMVFTKKSSS